MAHSPETHTDFNGGETRHPSLASLVEVALPSLETKVSELSAELAVAPDIQLALRLADLRVLGRQEPSILMPKKDEKDEDAHPPLLFTAPYTGRSFSGYHTVRRVIITHENQHQGVTMRDWLVNITKGTCWSFESQRERTAEPTAGSGPLVDIDGPGRGVTLSEGESYQAYLEAMVPILTKQGADEFSDFMAETRPFIGGRVNYLDMHNPKAFTHVRYPRVPS